MFEKMNGETLDLTKDNIDKLKQLFPEIVTDGKIDFEKLQVILGKEIDEAPDRYNFTWQGKKETMQFAQQPSKGTLRPVKEKSKDWDTTGNLYIEGDNLEVLKLLQKSYNNKIKMIYIDPPYNTGKDFVYKDNFKNGIQNYLEQTGQVDSEGNILSTNSESNGRFHTDWLNMIYSRLKLARNLLTDDGVIFISIDDSEQEKLKLICNEIFGENNFLAQLIWERAYAPINLKKNFSESHDFILVYGKSTNGLVSNGLKRTEAANDRYINADNDPRGVWKPDNFSVGPAIDKNIYEITTPSGRKVLPPSGRSWLYSKDKYEEMLKDSRVWFGQDGNSTPSTKRFLSEVKSTLTPMTIWKYQEVGHSQEASQSLKKLFDGKAYFTYPKPVGLVKRIVELYSNPDSIILDFFSGSATTAQAAMEINAEDGGNRKFIMVQLQEPLEENNEAYKDGYRTICDIGEERIRRAGEKVKSDLIEKNNKEGILSEYQTNPDDLDIGFKVFKLDSSNLTEWQASFDELETNIDLFESNFLTERSELDVLFEIMLKNGLDLTYPVNEISEGNHKIYDVAAGNLFVCLNDNINRDVARKIATLRKEYGIETSQVVFKDSGFENDTEKLNCYEILKEAGFQDSDLLSI